MSRPYRVGRKLCRDCRKPFEYRLQGREPFRCRPCRYALTLARNRMRRHGRGGNPLNYPSRRRPFIPKSDPGWPPLVSAPGYLPGSRGWFKAQLAAGHTAESLACLMRRDLEGIKQELSFLKSKEVA